MQVPIHRLEQWRSRFLAAGLAGLQARQDSVEAQELREAQAKIGELNMKIKLLERALGKKG